MMAKLVAEATDNKFQIQTFAAGEIVPGLQVLDAVQNGTVEMGHTASYYYFGKDPTFAFGTAVPFGPNQRLNQAWYMLGGGKELLNEFYKSYNVTLAPRRQYRLPDGRLVPQGDQDRRRSEGAEDAASAASPGACMQKLGVGAAADRRRRHLSGAGKRHHRRAPNGSGPMTTRSSASTRSRRIITIPGGGKAARCCWPSSISRNGMRCRRHYQSVIEQAGQYCQQLDDGEIRSGQSAGAAADCSPAAPSCMPSRRRSCRPASRRPRNCTPKPRRPMRTSRRFWIR